MIIFFDNTFAGQDDILMFGGSGGRESRPQYVQNEWSIATEFLKDFTGVVRPIKLLYARLIAPFMPSYPLLSGLVSSTPFNIPKASVAAARKSPKP